MSGYYDNSDREDEELERGNSGGGLRAQLEEALGEIKSLKKQLSGDRERTATELLKEKGIDPAVLALNSDGTDPVEWVEKNSHLLGAKAAPEPEAPIDAPEVTMATDDDPALVAEREARRDIAEAQAAGSQAVVSNDLLEQMGKIDSEDELLKFFRSNGGTA